MAQFLAMIQIWISADMLQSKLEAVQALGYPVVPHGQALEALTSLRHISLGAFFFTASLGVLITVISVLSLSVYYRIANPPHRFSTVLLISLWLLMVAGITLTAASPWLSLNLLLIPAAVYVCFSPVTARQWPLCGGLTCVLLSAVGVTSVMELSTSPFSEFRDRVLGETRSGQYLIESYYQYSQHPAQALRTLAQQPIRSILEQDLHSEEWEEAAVLLRQHRVYPVAEASAADLSISQENGEPFLQCRSGTQASRPKDDLRADPTGVLNALSSDCDNQQLFRQLVLHGFIFGLPSSLVLVIYSILSQIPGVAGQPYRQTLLLAPLLALSTALTLQSLSNKPYDSMTQDTPWTGQLAEINQLGNDAAEEATRALRQYASAENLYLSARAYRAIGQRGDPNDIEWLEEEFNNAQASFVQWEIYRALLRLGWHPINAS